MSIFSSVAFALKCAANYPTDTMRCLITVFLFMSAFLDAANLPTGFIKAVHRLGIPLTPTAIVIDVPSQRLTLYEPDKAPASYDVSTALRGVGSREGTLQTPPGLHRVKTKIGTSAAPFGIFVGRESIGTIWTPKYKDPDGHEDLVLSRILWLEGLEPGKNKGVDSDGRTVDSFKRFIYIHGTNHENKIGTPASQGCVRMRNDEVVQLYRRVPQGTLVWIQ